MARSRNIKPGFFKNEFLAEISVSARLLFIGLWTLADREGRLENRPRKIRAELFPFDGFDIDPMLEELRSKQFLHHYEVDGNRYIQIVNFVKHQDPHYKEKASEIPPPHGESNKVLATNITRTQRARIFQRDGAACKQCDAEENLCIDHVIPVSRGGDSSDENLQVLCMSCNTKKSNKLDGETSAQKKRKNDYGNEFDPPLNQVRLDIESCSDQQKRPSPSDPLIPDSPILIPDSQIPESIPQPPVGCDEAAPSTLPALATPKAKAETKGGDTWNAYSAAYLSRYGVEPVRNAKTSAMIAQLVDRLGKDDAPHVAAHFVHHSNAYYVANGHSVGCLLRDAEKLRTEWATGRKVTQTTARQIDRTASNPFAQMLVAGGA